MTRRDAAFRLCAFLSGSPVLAQNATTEPKDLVNVFDFEPIFRTKVPRPVYDFVTGGGWDETTVKRNRDAFQRVTFRPRFFVPVDKLDLSTTILGLKLSMPILVAPTGTQGLVHPDGEIAMARAAGKAGTAMAVSTNSSYPIARIADAASGPLIFQLYAGPDAEGTRDRVANAVAAGCKAVLFTADTPYHAPRERDIRNNFQRSSPDTIVPRRRRPDDETPAPTPPPYGLPLRFQGTLNWNFLDTVCGWAKVPVLVKGILTPEDAALAIRHGAAGVVVSNHGGRFLDGAPATLDVLPEIVDTIGSQATVLIDGGFRRGTDVLKALAIGANGVLLGRPPLWGLGSFGQQGAERVLDIMKKELAWAMGLAGMQSLAAIDRKLIRIEQ